MKITENQYQHRSNTVCRVNTAMSVIRSNNSLCYRAWLQVTWTTKLIRIKIEAVSMDGTSIKVHPDGAGGLKRTARNPSVTPETSGPPKFIWLP
ncbi:hypothetical protein C7H79_03855 [Nitrosomonas supralitoralis]|uniref:Uncharacterized protein n=2 Tax=Nitrosomonas supralitoralis TaxID=2116706 RepID=A0A2P7NY02_9PROT|nr:hypothetical protein C7H79_03855 [Nitrosomonas supralitoralis]